MFIGVVFYRNKGAAKGTPWSMNTAFRDEDKMKAAQQAETQARAIRASYEAQVLLTEVVAEVVPPELDVKLIPFKG